MNTELNKKLFDKDRMLYRDVRTAILNIAGEFVDSIDTGVSFPVLDIILVGSNVGYNYTETSDLDVHIIVNYEDLCDCKDVVSELFQTEKTLFNKEHNITIKGIPVEVYVEDIKTSTVSNGIYSVMFNRWEKIPTMNSVNEPEADVTKTQQFIQLKEIAQELLNNKNASYQEVVDFINSLYLMRKYSIAREGENGVGNLVFKKIRSYGWLDELKEIASDLRSKELSLKGDVVDEIEM